MGEIFSRGIFWFFWGFFLGFREEVERKKGFPRKERGVVGDRGMEKGKKSRPAKKSFWKTQRTVRGTALVPIG
jgi:hypothetical protein